MKLKKFLRKNPLTKAWQGLKKEDIRGIIQTEKGEIKALIIRGIGLVKI